MAKKIIRLTERELNEAIRDTLLLEMATFGTEKWGKYIYRIAVHGASTKDRPIPHIHIYLNTDVQPYKQFNFEVSLVDILCKDEINLIYQLDRKNNVKITNRTECSWTGYADIYNGIKQFLSSPPKSKRNGIFIDNLDRAIYEWNRETDFSKTENGGNPLKEYLDKTNLVVLPKYMKYFE